MELGPLEILYSWQSVLLAIMITTLTHGVKALIDVKFGGTAARRRSKSMGKLVLPAIPLVLGAVLGILIPLRPDVLMAYIAQHNVNSWAIGACYGIAVGQFADYIYQRFMNKKTQHDAAEGVPVAEQKGEN